MPVPKPASLCMDSGSTSRHRGYGRSPATTTPPFSLVLLFLLSLSTEASKPFQKLPLRICSATWKREKSVCHHSRSASESPSVFFSFSPLLAVHHFDRHCLLLPCKSIKKHQCFAREGDLCGLQCYHCCSSNVVPGWFLPSSTFL